MLLSSDTYEFIIGEIVYLFKKYEVKCIPVSGFELATKMGMTLVSYASLSSKKRNAVMKFSPDGFFFEDLDGREYIFYNDEIGYQRLNMTILHEIGHCVLDHGSRAERDEAEANFFAKYAAAPPPLVHQIRPNSPNDIACTFGLSYQASCYALDYYHKWLQYGGIAYKPHEIKLLEMFGLMEAI